MSGFPVNNWRKTGFREGKSSPFEKWVQHTIRSFHSAFSPLKTSGKSFARFDGAVSPLGMIPVEEDGLTAVSSRLRRGKCSVAMSGRRGGTCADCGGGETIRDCVLPFRCAHVNARRRRIPLSGRLRAPPRGTLRRKRS